MPMRAWRSTFRTHSFRTTAPWQWSFDRGDLRPCLARRFRRRCARWTRRCRSETFKRSTRSSSVRVSPRRFILTIITGFAGVALLLAALGIYAVLSYSVSQRLREIGIRMALGESAASIRGRIVGRTLLLAGVGIVVGATASLAASRVLRSLLYGVGPNDAIAFVTTAVVLVVVSALAGFLPARRASRTDPVVALRSA